MAARTLGVALFPRQIRGWTMSPVRGGLRLARCAEDRPFCCTDHRGRRAIPVPRRKTRGAPLSAAWDDGRHRRRAAACRLCRRRQAACGLRIRHRGVVIELGAGAAGRGGLHACLRLRSGRTRLERNRARATNDPAHALRTARCSRAWSQRWAVRSRGPLLWRVSGVCLCCKAPGRRRGPRVAGSAERVA